MKGRIILTIVSSSHRPKKINRKAALGMIIGAGIALFLAELGFDVEMSVGFIIGLSIGAGIDKRKK